MSTTPQRNEHQKQTLNLQKRKISKRGVLGVCGYIPRVIERGLHEAVDLRHHEMILARSKNAWSQNKVLQIRKVPSPKEGYKTETGRTCRGHDPVFFVRSEIWIWETEIYTV